ncbi:MAG: branched-chain amino acid ABC transporter permease [Deltaproteobacteria bacterium]|nr:branched-chain amino acid ABC transporter permease [Deltaproteobacteria bacterium]
MNFLLIQTLNGISFGMLLFLLAAGLSLIFGLMKVLNLAHGSFYLLGGYLGLTVLRLTDSFLLALLSASLAVTLVGILMERWSLRWIYGDELAQALLTFGFLFIIADLTLWVWGGSPQTLPKPDLFTGSVRAGAIVFPSYRLFVIAVGLVMGVGLWWLQENTRLGAMIRAGVDDQEMARGIGILAYMAAKIMIQAINQVGGKVEDRPAYLAALAKARVDGPMGVVSFDERQGLVADFYVLKVVKRDGQLQNECIDKIPQVRDPYELFP